jgi:hypothetical protein
MTDKDNYDKIVRLFPDFIEGGDNTSRNELLTALNSLLKEGFKSEDKTMKGGKSRRRTKKRKGKGKKSRRY